MSEKVTNRNRAVLDAALRLAASRGFRNITRQAVADEAKVAVGSVNNAYGTMDGLRDAVMAAAVERGLADIVAQGLTDKHPCALSAPATLRSAALESLAA